MLKVVLLILFLPTFYTTDDGGIGDTSPPETIALTQTISYSDDLSEGTLTISYPEGWVAEGESGSLTIANEPDILDRIGDDSIPQSGEMGGGFGVFPFALLDALGLDSESTLLDIYNFFAQFFVGEDSPFTLIDNDVTEFMTGGLSVVVGNGTGAFDGKVADFQLYIANINDEAIIFAIFVAPEGELAQYEPILRAILGSAEFEPDEN